MSSYIVSESQSQIIYNITYDNYFKLKKRINNITTIGVNNNFYSEIELSNYNWNMSVPISYSNEFYDYFMPYHFPLISGNTNQIYNDPFYNIPPYRGLLYYSKTFDYYISFNDDGYQSFMILDDIYINENPYIQKMFIPPVSYIGQIGYKIYLNNHEILYNRINIQSGLLKISNDNYVTDIPQEEFLKPRNIYYLLSPGRNRLMIEVLYEKNNFLNVYPQQEQDQYQIDFQFDFIVNNLKVVNQGLYQYSDLIQQKNMKYDNLQLAMIKDPPIYISNIR